MPFNDQGNALIFFYYVVSVSTILVIKDDYIKNLHQYKNTVHGSC